MRLINADALKSDIAKLKESPWFNTKAGYAYRKEAIESVEMLCVDRAPTVDPVKHGRWIENLSPNGDSIYECPICGEEWVLIEGDPEDNLYNYCPNCGGRMHGIIRAKMGGGEDGTVAE